MKKQTQGLKIYELVWRKAWPASFPLSTSRTGFGHLDTWERPLEMCFLFGVHENSYHDSTSLSQPTNDGIHDSQPALCTLHHGVGWYFPFVGQGRKLRSRMLLFVCSDYELKREEVRSTDNGLCKAAFPDLELTLPSLVVTLCSSSHC